MSKKEAFTLGGFLLFIIGFLSLILWFVGMQISFLSFLDQWGPLSQLAWRGLCIVVGIVTIYISKTDFTV